MVRKEIPLKAIREEEKAARLNSIASELTDSPGGAEMFRKLAEFHHHNAILLREFLTRDALFGDARRESTVAELSEVKGLSQHADAFSALESDIAYERDMAAMFREAAAKAETEEERVLLNRLAEEKSLDRRMLEDEFYALANQGLTVWGD